MLAPPYISVRPYCLKTIHYFVFVSFLAYHVNDYVYFFSGSGRSSGSYEYEYSEHEYDEHECEYYQPRRASTKWRCDGCRGQGEH